MEDVFSAMFTIHELHEYSDRVRTNFVNKLAELPWSEVEKNRQASFYSIKNILLHMIDNQEWMVNWVIRNKSKDYMQRKSDKTDSRKARRALLPEN